MSRKQALGFLALGTVLLGVLLFFLAVYTDPLIVLTVILAVVLSLGLLMRLKPELFSALRKPPKEDPYRAALSAVSTSAPASRGEARFTPHMILVSVDGMSGGQIVIDKPEFTLGRARGCDYTFPPPCPEISRVHMIVRYDGATGTSFLIDNDSPNGTLLNGKRLASGRPYPLANGDMIQAGTLRFTAQMAHY